MRASGWQALLAVFRNSRDRCLATVDRSRTLLSILSLPAISKLRRTWLEMLATTEDSLLSIVSLSSLTRNPCELLRSCGQASLVRNNAAGAGAEEKQVEAERQKALSERRIDQSSASPNRGTFDVGAYYGLGGIESAVANQLSHWLVIAGFSLAALQCLAGFADATENAGLFWFLRENAKQLSAQSHQNAQMA